MPIYEYTCESCGHELEALQGLNDERLSDCPECGDAALRKRISRVAFRLKGTGWYETDFKDKDKRNIAGDDGGDSGNSNAGKESSASSDSGGGNGSSASGDTATDSTSGASGSGEAKSSSKSDSGSESSSSGSAGTSGSGTSSKDD